MLKTNKSYTKRIKITRKGKLVARSSGHNHFNARDTGRDSLAKGRTRKINFLSNKAKSKFLANNL